MKKTSCVYLNDVLVHFNAKGIVNSPPPTHTHYSYPTTIIRYSTIDSTESFCPYTLSYQQHPGVQLLRFRVGKAHKQERWLNNLFIFPYA